MNIFLNILMVVLVIEIILFFISGVYAAFSSSDKWDKFFDVLGAIVLFSFVFAGAVGFVRCILNL